MNLNGVESKEQELLEPESGGPVENGCGRSGDRWGRNRRSKVPTDSNES